MKLLALLRKQKGRISLDSSPLKGSSRNEVNAALLQMQDEKTIILQDCDLRADSYQFLPPLSHDPSLTR